MQNPSDTQHKTSSWSLVSCRGFQAGLFVLVAKQKGFSISSAKHLMALCEL